MEKAKILLTCVIILGIIGGALAFRANRLPSNVYTLLPGNKVVSYTIGNVIYTTTVPNCTRTDLVSCAFSIVTSVSSTTTDPLVTTIFKSAGHPDQVGTYAYCTLWITRTCVAN